MVNWREDPPSPIAPTFEITLLLDVFRVIFCDQYVQCNTYNDVKTSSKEVNDWLSCKIHYRFYIKKLKTITALDKQQQKRYFVTLSYSLHHYIAGIT